MRHNRGAEDSDRSETGLQRDGGKFVAIVGSERSKNKEWKVELDYLEISAALGLYVGCCKNLQLKLSLGLFVVPDYVGVHNQIIPQQADVWNFKRLACL